MWLQSTTSTHFFSRRYLLCFMNSCILSFLLFATCSSVGSASSQEQQECSSNNSYDQQEACMVRPDPKVIINGEEIIIEEPRFKMHHGKYPPSSTSNSQAKNDESNDKSSLLTYSILNEEKPVLYVSNFLNETTSEELKQFCIKGGRFSQSPIGGYGDGSTRSVTKNELRTSESCVLVPAVPYLANPRYQEMIQQDPVDPQVAPIVREVDVSMDIAERASALLGVDSGTVEALQLVRYTTPDAQYQLHHDHGGFYNKETEHRPWTMLIFLNDVADGGHTSFPKLGMDVVPRGGDALIWSNIHESKVDPDMVHMGKPPSKEGVEKYAVNVWFGDMTFAQRTTSGERGF